ncbi:hypothetical protein [Curtobacterium sp. L1-20]|uniref:hypothetical protein n=1 Tax=Curtobacterium sp. L1-20 TaxID=3138181 RepID=UPI003B51FD6A
MTVVTTMTSPRDFPRSVEVRTLYQAAAGQPPLSEPPSFAELFASLYQGAIERERVVATTARDGGRLVAFSYGHPWQWEEQRYPWADELRENLGDEAPKLDGSVALNLLARAPGEQYRGLGRRVLVEWLRATEGAPCWLQTSDLDSPARRLYVSLGFAAIGHGPAAPNGTPGLVLFKLAADPRSR